MRPKDLEKCEVRLEVRSAQEVQGAAGGARCDRRWEVRLEVPLGLTLARCGAWRLIRMPPERQRLERGSKHDAPHLGGAGQDGLT